MSKATKNPPATTANPDRAAMSDEELLLAYRDHADRPAFDELVHRYERELYSYLRRYLGDAEMAEDAFQSSFLQIHLKCDQFDRGRKFRPWLYTIATNQAIDSQRRNKRHRRVSLDRNMRHDGHDELGSLLDLLVSKEPGPDDQAQITQQTDWVREAVGQLPDGLRDAVNLVYYQGLKYREAAEILNIPVGTVKSRLHSAILKLNQAWTEDEANSQP
jgi:RNA polymerase sigma-70 factor (ECF subfamily)